MHLTELGKSPKAVREKVEVSGYSLGDPVLREVKRREKMVLEWVTTYCLKGGELSDRSPVRGSEVIIMVCE